MTVPAGRQRSGGAFASGLPAIQHVPGGDPVRSAAVPAGDLRHVPFGAAEAHAFVKGFQTAAGGAATQAGVGRRAVARAETFMAAEDLRPQKRTKFRRP